MPSLHFLTDDKYVNVTNYWHIITQVVEGGVDVVQLRFKHMCKGSFYHIAKSLRPYLKANHVQLIINDHIDIALAVQSDGVHIGQDDLPYEVTREILGKNKDIGLSINALSQLDKSSRCDATYFGIGPIYQSHTKSSLALGLNQLTTITQRLYSPCIAIGGITQDTVLKTLEAGASGVAVCEAICAAPSPFEATKKFKEVLCKPKSY